jgi:hypothetical protein
MLLTTSTSTKTSKTLSDHDSINHSHAYNVQENPQLALDPDE